VILILLPGSQRPKNVANIFCQAQSPVFRFCLDGNRLKYIDLTGNIPANKQNWCEVRTTVIQGPPPPQYDLHNVVEIRGIPIIRILVLFINILQDLLDRYHSLRAGSHRESWLTNGRIKKIRTVIEPLMRNTVVPHNLDEACAALSVLKQLVAILGGSSPTSTQSQQLSDCLRRVSGKIDTWVNNTPRHVIDDDDDVGSPSPATQDVDHAPEPGTAVGEDCDESDDWVEVTISTGVIKTHGIDSPHGGERVEEVLDFELLSID
jgi:hypothetical protein